MNNARALQGLYTRLMHTPIVYLYSIFLAGLLTFAAAYWFFIYLPQQERLQQAYRELEYAYQERHRASREQKAQQNLTSHVARLRQEMNRALIVADPRSAQHMINKLIEASLKASVSLKECGLCNQYTKKWCKINECTGNFIARFEQMIQFFEQVRTIKPAVVCKRCTITRVDQSLFSVHGVFAMPSALNKNENTLQLKS